VNAELQIRDLLQEDNILLAKIIRDALTEFNAAKPGTVYYDETTDHLYEVFKKEGSKYFVATINNEVVGGAGIYPTDGLDYGTCELVKMYLSPAVRGKGVGKFLMEKCIATAKQSGYKKIYIETMPELKLAIPMYEKLGFIFLNKPMGNSGHTGCDVWMQKELA